MELDAANPQHSIIPGSGLADLVRQIVSVVMLGEYGEMGVTTTGYVKPQNGSGGGVVVGDLDGKASLTEDSSTRASGRIAYPALSGGVASFDPASNTQQGRFGKLEVKVDGSWSYTLGNDSASNARVQALRDGDVRTEVFVLTTTDGSQTTVTLTINGSNDQPQAQLSSLVEDGATSSSGRLQDSLAGLASVFLPGSFVGELGTLQLSADGAWQFALSANVQALAAGSSRRESFTVQTVDGATTTLTVEIIGVNDAAVISGQQSGNVAQDGAHSSSGQLQISDIDNGEAQFQAGSQTGSYGALQLDASGSWTYTLSNGAAVAKGQTVVEQFTVLAKDGTSSTVSISVTGGNHAAVIAGQQSGAVAKDGQQQASGQLSISDADAGEAVFVAQTLAGQHGSFSLQADGSWAYQLQDGSSIAKGVTVQESFQVQSADGSRSTVVIAVTGGNHAASVSGQLAGAVAQDGQRSSSGQLLVNDIDAGEAVFVAASSQGKYGQLQLQADGSWVYQLQDGSSIAKGATSQDSFTVRTAEGTSVQLVITVTGGNHAAVIGGALSGAVQQGGSTLASGQLSISDSDAGEAAFVAQRYQGSYGVFSQAADGQWQYQLQDASALAKGAVVNETFVVSSLDGSQRTVSIAVTGGNHSAVISGDSQGSVKADGKVQAAGQLQVSDIDQGEARVQAGNLAGLYTASSAWRANGQWQYQLAGNASLAAGSQQQERFTVLSQDGTARFEIVIAVAGADVPAQPVITEPQTDQQVVQALQLANGGSSTASNTAGSTAGTTSQASQPSGSGSSQAEPGRTGSAAAGSQQQAAEGDGEQDSQQPVVSLATLGEVLFTPTQPLQGNLPPVSNVVVQLAAPVSPAQQTMQDVVLSEQAEPDTAETPAAQAAAGQPEAPATEVAPAVEAGSDVVSSAAPSAPSEAADQQPSAQPAAAAEPDNTAAAQAASDVMAQAQDMALGLAALTSVGRSKILWDRQPGSGKRAAERGTKNRR